MLNPLSLLGAADFQQAALNLLPRGWAFLRDLNLIRSKFFGAVGDMFASTHANITNITDVELFPPTTQALLPDFEAEYQLPEPCTPLPQSYEQRIVALVGKITDIGSLSKQKFIDLAAALGFEITITEFLPSSGVGTCIGLCTDPVLGPSWRFAWQVNAPETTYSVMTCVGLCTDPLRSWGNEPLECAIKRKNRPSRFVLFSYGG